MNTITKVSLLLFVYVCMQQAVYADCPDGQYLCPLTGSTIKYGKCWDWDSVSCKPCSSSYKNQCNDKLYNRWMSKTAKVQKSSIMEITIPGAHDAGMGKISSCSDYAGKDVTQTQDRSFIQMLNSGIRYFDIRPIIDQEGKMYLGHYTWVGRDIDLIVHKFTLRNEGCLGYSMDEMLDDVRSFVSTPQPDNKEIIILNLDHFKNFKKYDNKNSHFDKKDLDQLKSKIVSKLDGYLIKGNTDFLKKPINTLTKTGAKVIVTFHAEGYDGSDGIYSQKYLNLYDEYSKTNDFNKMKADQFKKMTDHSTSKYFLLSWTLTQDENQAIGCMIPENLGKRFGYDCESIKSLANIANMHLHEIPTQSIKTKKYPNIIYTDYVSEDQTILSILINKAR